VNQQSVTAADEEWIASANPAPVTPLLSLLDIPADGQIEVMDDANAASYWHRSDMFDLGLDLSAGQRGLAALAEAMSRWIRHLLAIDVTIEPLAELRDAKFTWYVGLDSEATRIGDRLWNDEFLDDSMAGRVAALFQLVFSDHTAIIDGRMNDPVYLILAASPDQVLRMKPQNLVTGLPVKHLEAAS
jgi:hypothetical protein